jgi:hypothetical protein
MKRSNAFDEKNASTGNISKISRYAQIEFEKSKSNESIETIDDLDWNDLEMLTVNPSNPHSTYTTHSYTKPIANTFNDDWNDDDFQHISNIESEYIASQNLQMDNIINTPMNAEFRTVFY